MSIVKTRSLTILQKASPMQIVINRCRLVIYMHICSVYKKSLEQALPRTFIIPSISWLIFGICETIDWRLMACCHSFWILAWIPEMVRSHLAADRPFCPIINDDMDYFSCQKLHRYLQGILKREVSLYRWPPVWPVWNQPYDNWQILFLFAKQTNPNQSNRRYSDTSPFSIPWYLKSIAYRLWPTQT